MSVYHKFHSDTKSKFKKHSKYRISRTGPHNRNHCISKSFFSKNTETYNECNYYVNLETTCKTSQLIDFKKKIINIITNILNI